ncbi:MAG: hypothetical protein COA74_15035 [Gammaproteobacteria bacterium]|nr:MAG: hypothetical protein COA74_15035 [Gammaproteobacteria bacterium]
MKPFKLAHKTLLALAISTFAGSGLAAKTIDVSKSQKDIRVMTKIIEASLESSNDNFPGKARIEGLYLASQGYLFTIQLNGLSSFGVPGLASWDRGRLELDIPELINQALTSFEHSESLSVAPEVISNSLASLYADDDLQDNLKELRKKQRDLKREDYQLRREIRKAEDENARKKLEDKLSKNRDSLKRYSKKYTDLLNSYKAERTSQRVEKSSLATNAIFSTLCDYGQSLRALKKNEKVTLMIKGGVGEDGEKATQLFIMNKSSLNNCNDSVKLRKNSIHYSL